MVNQYGTTILLPHQPKLTLTHVKLLGAVRARSESDNTTQHGITVGDGAAGTHIHWLSEWS